MKKYTDIIDKVSCRFSGRYDRVNMQTQPELSSVKASALDAASALRVAHLEQAAL